MKLAPIVVAVAAFLALPVSASAGACGSPHWVGSWAVAPSDVSPTQPLVDQSLRMIAAPHLAGSTIRVRLSNRFGSQAVTLGPVTIATEADGAATVDGSMRDVRFRGADTVTIPVGGEVASDPVAFTVRPLTDVAVSVSVPGVVTDATEHFFTRQTSYLSPSGTGDHAHDAGGVAFVEPTTRAYSNGWYFLDGIDVLAAAETGAVATFGDSITDGFQGLYTIGTENLTVLNDNRRYPDALARRLDDAGIPLSVLNEGIGSNKLLTSADPRTNAGPSGISRFAADVLDQPGVTDAIVLEGINDITSQSGITAQEIIDGYLNLIAQAHAAGIRIQLATITPTGGANIPPPYDSTKSPIIRGQVNDWIRSQHESDGIVDFDAAVRDPSDPGRINPAYDGSDHVHFNVAGYSAMAAAVPFDLLARATCQQRDPAA
jgi:lysophospholipase L1-like esterase